MHSSEANICIHCYSWFSNIIWELLILRNVNILDEIYAEWSENRNRQRGKTKGIFTLAPNEIWNEPFVRDQNKSLPSSFPASIVTSYSQTAASLLSYLQSLFPFLNWCWWHLFFFCWVQTTKHSRNTKSSQLSYLQLILMTMENTICVQVCGCIGLFLVFRSFQA